MSEYWKQIKTTVKTLNEGLKVTMKHMKDARGSREALYTDDQNYFEKENGLFTTQYPKESLPVPDHGRYKLHNEIDDCIVCDKCAKVCPVNCIDIEPVRSVGEIGKTSDGTSKRIYAAKFDIDMAKCCFCGLCTTVCPTECLTMTDEFDFSTYDIKEHNFEFGEMTPLEILEKKKELEEFNKQKEAEKAAKATGAGASPAKPQVRPRPVAPKVAGEKPKPVFRPKVPGAKPANAAAASTATPKPVMKPKVPAKKDEAEGSAKPKPVFRPKVPGKKPVDTQNTEAKASSKPVMKPKIPMAKKAGESGEATKPKPVMRPKIPVQKKEESPDQDTAKPKAAKPKIPMRPKIPIRKPDKGSENSEES